MTTNLEKQFFNMFGIKPIGCNDNKNCTGTLDCTQCPNAKYPEITDRILLELICIASLATECEFQEVYKIFTDNYNDLKEQILVDCKFLKNHIKYQVQALFKEER